MSYRLCPLKKAAREAPHQLAFLSRSDSRTFSELDSEVDFLCSQLSQLKIQSGDRIAVLHPPCPPLIALFFAAWRLNASICPLNLRSPPAQIKRCIERLSPKLFIDSFPISNPVLPSNFRSQEERSLFLFTSGSTGIPKIAVLTLDNLIASASSYSFVDLQNDDRWLLSLPLFHVSGIGIVLRCILARATIVLDESDPKITHLSYVPSQLYRATPVYKNLKCILLGGAPILSYPENLPIFVTYGLTEMGSWITARNRPPRINGYYYLGFPLPDREIRLQATGEIFVRGKTLFQGYWENGRIDPPQDWFATGDIGLWDAKEGLAIRGRKDWQFISGGENIQPEEIEQYLLQIPEVIEAVVVPQNHDQFGQRPAAFVRTSDPSFNLHRLQTSLQDQLPKYKIPVFLFLLDEMPRNGLKTNRKKIFEIANQKI